MGTNGFVLDNAVSGEEVGLLVLEKEAGGENLNKLLK